MKKSRKNRLGWITAGLLFCCVTALAARRVSEEKGIRADQINAGGANYRTAYYTAVRDVVGSPQPNGITQSNHYINQGGLAYLIAEPEPGDLNEDGKIDVKDLYLFAGSWKTEPTDPNYHYQADIVQSISDRRINEEDLFEFIRLLHHP